MLLNLSIRDVVLIDRLDIELESGLSALTGETGAGKSILLDALGLALGVRADSALVRPGAPQAVVTAEFAVGPDHPARAILAEQAVACDGNIILRRQLGADGRSRAFINDESIGVALLKRVGGTLVEIEGQFEQQGLMDSANHRAMLDLFAGHRELIADVGESWRRWKSAAAAREALETEILRARRDEAYLRHAVEELRACEPRPGEEAELADARRLLMNREKIIESVRAALAELDGERGAESSIAAAQRRLDRLADKAGDQLSPAIAALDRAASEAADAAAHLRRVLADLDGSPGRLEQIEERLFGLRDLARKHAVVVDDLATLCERLSAQLAALDDQSGRLTELSRAEVEYRRLFEARAEALGKSRAKAAARLDSAVNAELPPLKLEKARFATRLERLPEGDWNELGRERVIFEISTNLGMPPGPLSRIASGGELSRLMLALKVVLAAADPVPTLVFDEVDSGVGGATAAAVGERLARLGKTVQVLVVTHSPQVAARAARHWRVEKLGGGKAGAKIVTKVTALDDKGRREEIARMLSGATVTDEARAAADRLMSAPPARKAAR
jgi:DNA repair protein RecN (Recombination protein N)